MGLDLSSFSLRNDENNEISRQVFLHIVWPKHNKLDRDVTNWILAMTYGWTYDYVDSLTNEEIDKICQIAHGYEQAKKRLAKKGG
jgi:hypothetical protein